MRLIDADELKKKSYKHTMISQGQADYGFEYEWDCVDTEDLEDAPTIDAEPVRHGHWETLLIGNIQCSRCGHEPYWDSDDWKLNCGNPYYCPNCGAKMDKEDKT